MTPRHMLMGAALVVAAGFAIFGDKTPGGEVVEPVVRAPAASTAPARVVAAAPKDATAPAILRLLPRDELIAAGDGADAFGSRDWTPPPPPPQPAPPPPPPTAPPLPFTFVGKAVEKGEWEVFLARGAETLIVRNKTVIDGVYRVDAIAPPGMTFTYLPMNQVQQLNIGVRD
ncbi:hypothetical protein CR105_12605 [Massilia eurypsychrophila]|jgi:hypothetical protein|uniref:Prolin-rich transmembrane protein n=1 Tax=Massilia eurypsychrophila TaxID=1485217 RepID=A0A2G8TFD2_9BURK|nr:hypothetical protein [Massilia eurypsychrophila]PIL44746.1 hypothetical protein CR105_12605 [Massilia eurypsychrophila]